jgi:hypothetical protein
MRRVPYIAGRGLAFAVVLVLLAGTAVAGPREDRAREKRSPVVKAVKKMVRALGDLLTIPLP